MISKVTCLNLLETWKPGSYKGDVNSKDTCKGEAILQTVLCQHFLRYQIREKEL